MTIARETDATLGFYDREAAAYLDRTVHVSPHPDLFRFLDGISRGAHLLDLGSGGGDDAAFMLARGFTVTAIDGSLGLALEARRRHGLNVRLLRFEDLDYDEVFDGIHACASLVHVPGAAQGDILKKVARGLKRGGRLYASFKAAPEDWYDKDGRLFGAMDETRLRDLAEDAGLVPDAITTHDSHGWDGAPVTWIALFSRKG